MLQIVISTCNESHVVIHDVTKEEDKIYDIFPGMRFRRLNILICGTAEGETSDRCRCIGGSICNPQSWTNQGSAEIEYAGNVKLTQYCSNLALSSNSWKYSEQE